MKKCIKNRIVSVLIAILCSASIGFAFANSNISTPVRAISSISTLSLVEDATCAVTQVSGTTYQSNSAKTTVGTEIHYTGVKLALSESASEKAMLKGVFTDDFSMNYTVDTTGQKLRWAFVKVYDLDGNELFAVARR